MGIFGAALKGFGIAGKALSKVKNKKIGSQRKGTRSGEFMEKRVKAREKAMKESAAAFVKRRKQMGQGQRIKTEGELISQFKKNKKRK